MKTPVHIIILTLIGLPVFRQSGTTLSGTVQEAGGKPLSFTTVALLAQSDTTRLAKATSTDGQFAFDNVQTGQYIVRAMAVGFQKMQSGPVTVAASPVELPTLRLSEATGQLNAVQVVAKEPFVEQQLDRMVVNVAGSIVGSGSTALEVLEPSITPSESQYFPDVGRIASSSTVVSTTIFTS